MVSLASSGLRISRTLMPLPEILPKPKALNTLPRENWNEPVASVARHVGYESASAFVAAFRRETGLTPATYFRRGASPT